MSKLIIKIYFAINIFFINLDTAMTEKELDESSMERAAWWECIINVVLCISEDVADSNNKQKEAAAQAAEVQTYISQCK
jgi:hypothetical protein